MSTRVTYLNRMPVSIKLSITAGVFILGLGLYAGLSMQTTNTVKINGPLYQTISEGKDLIADIAPPPAYIVGSYLVVNMMLDEPDKAKLEELIKKLDTLKSDFESRSEYWSKQDLNSAATTNLLKQAYQSGRQFYATAYQDLIPALRSGNKGAEAASLSKLGDSYASQAKSIDQALELVSQRVMADKDNATAVLASAQQKLYTILAVVLAVGIAFSTLVARSLVSRVKLTSGFLNNIADNKLDNTIPTDGGDELGQMLIALDAAQRNINANLAGINKTQAVIEFALDGKILTANANFLNTLGYTLEEIKGKHHSMFAEPAFAASTEYRQFWEKLGRGEFDAGQYKRLGKGGKVVWIQASYNPIMGMDGKPFKVVKYATDITEQVKFAEQMKLTVDEAGAIATAATAGDLTKRISLEGKSGALEALSKGINELVGNVAIVVDEVQKLVASANDGDLTKRIEFEGKAGLLVKIGTGINQLTDNMSEIVGKVKSAASSVTRGADEISQGNTNLSQRTEEQASSLEETASSMEEMTSTVKQNADNAGQANQLAVAARDQAEKGGAVVAKAVVAMAEINDASRKIADIIGVIDEIAFQTNLLALNAAVEAARAGEQGRGFAVVATEVRNLAGRSATAAKEIKGLIQDSVKKVEEGSSLVAQSGQTLEQLVSAVKKVSDIIAEIAAASQEQSSGIEQVNKAVMQLDEMTQQNAALVEEASAASASMADQARSLNEMMDRYEVSQAVVEAAERAMAAASSGSGARSGGAHTPDAAERRAPARPWSKSDAKAPAAKGPASRAPVAKAPAARAQARAANGTDSEWKEF